jgi:hypothetical protein
MDLPKEIPPYILKLLASKKLYDDPKKIKMPHAKIFYVQFIEKYMAFANMKLAEDFCEKITEPCFRNRIMKYYDRNSPQLTRIYVKKGDFDYGQFMRLNKTFFTQQDVSFKVHVDDYANRYVIYVDKISQNDTERYAFIKLYIEFICVRDKKLAELIDPISEDLPI